MLENRCHNCNRLLILTEGVGETEIICPNCRRINYCGRDTQEIGLRGKSFQQQAVDLNCVNCTQLLGRAIGNYVSEVKCFRCDKINTFNTKEMKRQREMPYENRKMLKEIA